MSIRLRILIPLAAIVAIAAGLCAFVGWRSNVAVSELAASANQALSANAAAQAARDAFESVEQLIVQVLGMVDFIEQETIERRYNDAALTLEAALGNLKTAATTTELRQAVERASDAHENWRGDAKVILGIAKSQNVPTPELMSRHSGKLRAELVRTVDLVGGEAHRAIEAIGASLKFQIVVASASVAIATLLGIGIAFGLVRGITRPILAMRSAMRRIANGDLSIEVDSTDRHDEIGAMALVLRELRDQLSRAESARTRQVDSQRLEAEKLVRRNAITQAFMNRMEQLATGFTSSSSAVADSATALLSTAGGTTNRANTVSGAAHEASTNVQVVAAAADLLVRSINEINDKVNQSVEVAGSASDEAQRTDRQMRNLNEAATRIGDVVSLIKGIADQTNLLALNATIEAARAGESGRGFAVVASEVKALASQTAKATEEISSKVGEIQSAMSTTVGSIGTIVTTIGNIRQLATSIAGAVEQQRTASVEIADNCQRAASGASDVSINITAVGEAAQTTGSAASDLMELAKGLMDRTQDLQQDVARFVSDLKAA